MGRIAMGGDQGWQQVAIWQNSRKGKKNIDEQEFLWQMERQLSQREPNARSRMVQPGQDQSIGAWTTAPGPRTATEPSKGNLAHESDRTCHAQSYLIWDGSGTGLRQCPKSARKAREARQFVALQRPS
jgi:hypothetical protein